MSSDQTNGSFLRSLSSPSTALALRDSATASGDNSAVVNSALSGSARDVGRSEIEESKDSRSPSALSADSPDSSVSGHLKASAINVSAGPRFPNAPPLESPDELDEFLRSSSPSSLCSGASSRDPRTLRTPPATVSKLSPRSILRTRSSTDAVPFPPDPVRQTRRRTDDPAMLPVSPASPDVADSETSSPGSSPARSEAYSSLRTPTPSPPKSSIPALFRRDGLMTAGIPPSVPAEFTDQETVLESPSAGSRNSAVEDDSGTSAEMADSDLSPPPSIAELWNRLEARDADRLVDDLDRTRLVAYALLRPPQPTDNQRFSAGSSDRSLAS
ncbi:hypothetical protein PHYPSEUDO_015142 [Phytophthora pseudosyringae]|uniref:Uncharacterized protein n=1 Tax=Phytophthora pseudosyringae TaxID=221518 RepID=A0A8T1V660_9STRA|nr:hypothetical protein PHYPSEUDO_015142 [Phytophthora pseudosyringae]